MQSIIAHITPTILFEDGLPFSSLNTVLIQLINFFIFDLVLVTIINMKEQYQTKSLGK